MYILAAVSEDEVCCRAYFGELFFVVFPSLGEKCNPHSWNPSHLVYYKDGQSVFPLAPSILFYHWICSPALIPFLG